MKTSEEKELASRQENVEERRAKFVTLLKGGVLVIIIIFLAYILYRLALFGLNKSRIEYQQMLERKKGGIK
jgi:hypothetical protein